MEYKISIIIPVYNVEKYLNRCIESIVKQTYQNLEIILVDDGATDSCGSICDLWTSKDKRIKVIHKENGGLSEARNFGIEISTGEYITFVDSDDYISENYILSLYNNLLEYEADISCCNARRFDGSVCDFSNTHTKILCLSNVEACKLLYDNKFYEQMVVAWGKLYKACLVKKNKFPIGRIHEDEANTYKLLYEARKIVVSNEVLYGYYQNPNSITHQRTEKNVEDFIWALENRMLYFEDKCEWELYAKTVNFYIGTLIWNKRYEKLKKCSRKFFFNKHVLMKTKIKIILYEVRKMKR